jgi:formylglycine-generating enzyme required for sulfatase activity/cytochrome oxidase Cu insertion factor (SCO1/SenC/PrrC family)
MNRLSRPFLAFAVLANLAAVCPAQPVPPGMARVPDGIFRPFYTIAAEPKESPVKAFNLDVLPVTVGEYLEFVRENPIWRRSRAKRIFADESYLKNWAGDLDPGANTASNTPVTFVSWFAANACAEWSGKRLPTVAEWEYAAAAGPNSPDGASDAAFHRRVLAWYNSPSPARLAAVGSGEKNFWGIQDLHGLVWEWVGDFNTAMVTGDARGDTGPDARLFCGAGALGARDVLDYPAFMRYGFRSSLKGNYCVRNLGFRRASDPGAEIKTARGAGREPPPEPAVFPAKSLYQTESQWTTDAGVKIKLAELSGKPRVIILFFARCQSACPLLVNDLKKIQTSLPQSPRSRAGFTLVSFDTKNDTPAALAEYRLLRDLDENWTLLSGNPNGVLELAALLGARYQRTAGGGFAHSNLVTILNANGEIAYQQAGLGLDTEAAARALQQLMTP